MRLIYFDEAGLANPRHEPFLVVAGIMVHGDEQLNKVKIELERLLWRHVPPHQRSAFVFHATELFNGGGRVFKRYGADFIGAAEWPRERRLQIADEFAQILAQYRLPIAVGFADRQKFLEDFPQFQSLDQKNKNIMTHTVAYATSAVLAENWMRDHVPSENCLMVVEDNDQARESLRNFHNLLQNKEIFSYANHEKFGLVHLQRVQEDPLFQPKKPSNPLILADFVAYVFKRILADNTGPYTRFYNVFHENLILMNPAKIALALSS